MITFLISLYLAAGTIPQSQCVYKADDKVRFDVERFWWPQWGESNNKDRIELEDQFGVQQATICESDYCTFYDCCVQSGQGCFIERPKNGTVEQIYNELEGCIYMCNEIMLYTGPGQTVDTLTTVTEINIQEKKYDPYQGETIMVSIKFAEKGKTLSFTNELNTCASSEEEGTTVEILIAEWDCTACGANKLFEQAKVLLEECCHGCQKFITDNHMNGENENDPRYVTCLGCDRIEGFGGIKGDTCGKMDNYVMNYVEKIKNEVPFDTLTANFEPAFFEGLFTLNGSNVEPLRGECKVQMDSINDLENSWNIAFQDCRACSSDKLLEQCCRTCEKTADNLAADATYQICSGCDGFTKWGEIGTIWNEISNAEENTYCGQRSAASYFFTATLFGLVLLSF